MKLIDFLVANQVLLAPDFRVHLATPSSSDPLTAYYKNQFKEWQEWQGKDNFKGKHIVSLIQTRRKHKWLFAGVYEVLGKTWLTDHYEYDTRLVPGHEDWIGRVIAHHEREGKRKPYRIGANISDSITLDFIREEPLTVDEFPGYHLTCIAFEDLRTIVQQSVESWRVPLQKVKGIYSLTDQENGKLYVGKADGESGIWGRWSSYVASMGTGGNKKLRELLEGIPIDHLAQMQFAILEIADMRTSSEVLDEREGYWKNVFLTRKHGYNAN
ncbi:MAG: GIY-YIG nuclease family protein [Flavobacteriales bacterium]